MKTKLKLLIAALCGVFVTTAAFGQFSGNYYVWTNSAVGDISVAANWTNAATGANGIPTSGGDTMEFNGASSGPVIVTANSGVSSQQNNNGQDGLCIYVSSNQTSSVTLCTTVAHALAPYTRWGGPVTIDSGAGTFNLGNASTTNALQFEVGTANPQTHYFTNNSANTAIIWPNVAVRAGGGGAHTFDFAGKGTWSVTNDLNMDNGASSHVQVDGPGTLIWTAGHNTYSIGNSSVPSSPIVINGGSLILKSPGLFASTVSSAINNNGTLLEWDLGTQSQTFSGNITGTGVLQVNSGTLTLGAGGSGGQSTYTGNTILTGGELVVNGVENFGTAGPLGIGGFITFTGGTLGFSSANTYDYSPRFTNSNGQAFSFDTAGQNVTFTNSIVSSGGTLTKLGSGALTLAGANTYDGATTVSAGKLVIQGSQGSGGISVANSAALGVTGGGAQIAPATLTVGTTGGAILEFNNVSSTTTAPLAVAGAVSAGGPITINVNSGSFNTGQSYPLFSWGSGNPPPVILGTVVGAVGNLTTNGSTIQLNVTGLAFTWTGNNNADWDTSTANNWKVNGVAQIWADGSAALFDDTVTTANTNIILNSPVSPASTTVNNSVVPYAIYTGGANLIGGTGGFTKDGSGLLWMTGSVNTYGGATTLNGGILGVAGIENGGVASDIGSSGNSAANLVLNGGTLQFLGFYGSATSDRLFTLGTAGGTIDNEGGTTLTLNNPGAVALSGSGARTLVLADAVQVGATPAVDTLAAAIGDNGGATALNKSGAGTWILTGNNTNSGTVTINAGTLQVGAGASGSIGSGNVVNHGILDFNIAGTLTNGVISGAGSVVVDGSSTVVLPGNNTYSGGTTINSGTLQVGTGGAAGSLSGGQTITDNGLLIFNTTGSFNYSAPINGSGNVIVRGNGCVIAATGNNTYSGWTEIDPGATLQPIYGGLGNLLSSVVTNNGTLLCALQDNPNSRTIAGPIVGTGSLVTDGATAVANGTLILTGPCSYTGGTIIRQGILIVGDGSGNGWITGNVLFTNSAYGYEGLDFNGRNLHFNHPDDVTFPGNITGPGGTLNGGSVGEAGTVVQDGSGTLTLTGNNTYLAGTVINAGMLQVGNGGTSGSIGSGAVTDNGTLIFNRSDSVTFTNAISGSSSTAILANSGPGTVTLAGDGSAFTGNLMVTNGTLVVNGTNAATYAEVFAGATLGGSGQVEISGFIQVDAGGTLAPGGSSSSIGTLTLPPVLLYGNLAIKLNKSLAQSNDVVNAALGNSGTGTLIVTNLGPDLKVGDKFTVLSQASSYGGSSLTIIGANASWQNNLDSDGSITVLTVTNTGPGTFTNKPGIQTFSLNQANVVISGTNGQAGDAYYLLASTNVALPLSQWGVVATNVLSANGNFTFIGTNVVTPNSLHQFYILSNTNH